MAMRRMESPQRLGGHRSHYYLETLLNYFNDILKLPTRFNVFRSLIEGFGACCERPLPQGLPPRGLLRPRTS